MLRFFLAPAALFCGVVVFVLCSATYGKQIFLAPSASAAAPLAAPFLLFTVATGASVALCAASVCDAAEKASRFSR